MKLLLFKVNQLGDNVVFLPVVQWLLRSLRDTEITILTSPMAAPLYETCAPGVRVLRAETKAFNESWKHPFQLRRLHQLVQFHGPQACLLADDQGNVAHLLARTSGAHIRVGGRHARVKLNMLLTHLAILNLHEHVAIQNWKIMILLLEALGLPTNDVPPLPPAPDLAAFCEGDRERLVVIHPGASREYKRWPLERYVALANALHGDLDVVFISQGGAAESGLHKKVRAASPQSLKEFIGLMGRAALFIGNNSGPMNIAAALGVPGIIFNGPSAKNWDPAWHADRLHLLRDPDLACQPCDKWDHPVNKCQNAANPMTCMLRWDVEHVRSLALARLAAD